MPDPTLGISVGSEASFVTPVDGVEYLALSLLAPCTASYLRLPSKYCGLSAFQPVPASHLLLLLTMAIGASP
jgi:hypothetical protein